MVLFYLIDAIVHFSFMTELANPFIIAMIHSIFNLSAVIIMLPISEVLVKLAMKTIPVTPDELEDVPVEKSIQILDERFLASPHFALEQCKTAAGDMAEYAREALLLGMGLVTEFHPEQAKRVENLENLVDSYEDQLGTYLVKLSSRNLSTRDSHTLSTLLHCIGDFERICDHAINLVGYAQEMAEKDLHFSAKAEEELKVFTAAVQDIMNRAVTVFKNDDLKLAKSVEPLEEVIDGLNMEIKRRHIRRLRKGKCTIELGLTLSDITTCYERVADHCSNIAGCVIDAAHHDLNMHATLDAARRRAYGFRTFPAAGSGCSFLVLNDIHGKADVLTRLCKRVDFSELGFVAFNGDMSSSVESGEQLFKDYLDASAALFAAGTPILFTRGNHETRGVFADSLGDYFPGRDGRFYGIYRYGDVCILLLDCGEDKPDDHAEYNGLADYDAYRAEECAWLKKAVRSEEFLTASARIVLLHIPPATGAWHGSVHLNELFVPVLNEAGIDLMLCGHDHRYSFHPAGERDAKFPIVVNDNRSCVRCDVADSLIRVRIAGPRDKTVHTHEFPLKPQFQP